MWAQALITSLHHLKQRKPLALRMLIAHKKAPQSSSFLSGLLGGNLGDIKIDEEKALIGLLIYILYKQGADIKLLLALGYLLL